jgi:hypothetical protein
MEVPLPAHGSVSQNNDTRLEIFFGGRLMRGLHSWSLGLLLAHVGAELEKPQHH